MPSTDAQIETAPPPSREFEVAGLTVRIKERIPLSLAPKLPKMLADCGDGDFRTQVKVLALVLESWGFAGDPSDTASYEDLDVFDIAAMGRHVGLYLGAKLTHDPKAAGSAAAPSSPSRSRAN